MANLKSYLKDEEKEFSGVILNFLSLCMNSEYGMIAYTNDPMIMNGCMMDKHLKSI